MAATLLGLDDRPDIIPSEYLVVLKSHRRLVQLASALDPAVNATSLADPLKTHRAWLTEILPGSTAVKRVGSDLRDVRPSQVFGANLPEGVLTEIDFGVTSGLRGYHARLSNATLSAILERPEIDYIEPNRV